MRRGAGIGEMEAAAVEARLVRDVVHRVDDVIDRHHVHAAAFDADRRHPWRQRLAQLLERTEEIIGPVDLVDLAGLRMAEDDAPADRCGTAACIRARTMPSDSCLVRKYGWSRSSASANMSSRNTP